jgi:nucleoside-diphosphate-sugar epimerase
VAASDDIGGIGRVLVTGTSGHLGEALALTLRAAGVEVAGLDILPGPWTTHVGDVADRAVVRAAMAGVATVLHTATLHKPHVATHTRQAFVDTNVTGTLNLLEEAAASGVRAFVYTSTTSVFGDALVPPPGAPAAWITEDVRPVPKNINGVTKEAAENLCQLFFRNLGLAVVVLRTSRFFPEPDDRAEVRAAWADDNAKVNEFLYRRADIEDVVSAHLCAALRAPAIGFARYIVSAPAPFAEADAQALRDDAPAVVARHVPEYAAVYAARGWRMLPSLDRVYVSARAERDLGWRPKHDFRSVIARVAAGGDWRSALARRIGYKGYHAETFAEGPYPVEGPTRGTGARA